jgi:hypothetical protein
MHDGSIATLVDVVRHCEKGGIDRAVARPCCVRISLTEDERRDLVSPTNGRCTELMRTRNAGVPPQRSCFPMSAGRLTIRAAGVGTQCATVVEDLVEDGSWDALVQELRNTRFSFVPIRFDDPAACGNDTRKIAMQTFLTQARSIAQGK